MQSPRAGQCCPGMAKSMGFRITQRKGPTQLWGLLRVDKLLQSLRHKILSCTTGTVCVSQGQRCRRTSTTSVVLSARGSHVRHVTTHNHTDPSTPGLMISGVSTPELGCPGSGSQHHKEALGSWQMVEVSSCAVVCTEAAGHLGCTGEGYSLKYPFPCSSIRINSSRVLALIAF